MPANDVIVIGAGVVGLSAAIAAQGRGLSVTVIDREGPAAGASAGNAGAFAFTDILPLASPGILWSKGAHWLGRTPWISTSDPGQNMVPVRIPAFSAVTQIGSP